MMPVYDCMGIDSLPLSEGAVVCFVQQRQIRKWIISTPYSTCFTCGSITGFAIHDTCQLFGAQVSAN